MKQEPDRTSAADGTCRHTGMEGAHAAAIRRMIKDAPPFRPEASPEELVAEFANGENRMAAFLALYARGADTPDVRVLPVFKKILSEEADRKLRLHAEQGLQRYAAAGCGHEVSRGSKIPTWPRERSLSGKQILPNGQLRAE